MVKTGRKEAGVHENYGQKLRVARVDNVSISATSLFIGLFTGLLGTGYFIYDKKQQKMVAMLVGMVQCIVLFVVNGRLASSIVSALLCAVPFFVSF